jgi:hypothetical protein
MRFLAILACCAAFCGAARAETDVHAPHPLRVSFADMVRLSAGAPPLPEPAAAPRRVSFAAPAAADEPLFSVRPAREPAWWLLVFSGLAAAGWVAHRRLVNPL